MSRIDFVRNIRILSKAEIVKENKNKEVSDLKKKIEEQGKTIKAMNDRIALLEINRITIQPPQPLLLSQPIGGGNAWRDYNGTIWYTNIAGTSSPMSGSLTLTGDTTYLTGMNVFPTNGSITTGNSSCYMGSSLTGNMNIQCSSN